MIRDCYCYNRECNIKDGSPNSVSVWMPYYEELDKEIPKCSYCKKEMTITASIYGD